MFNIGWSEFLIIGAVALIAIGPKELPGVLRMAGQWIGKARRMANEFQGQFQEAIREADLMEAKKGFEDAVNSANDATSGLLPDLSAPLDTTPQGLETASGTSSASLSAETASAESMSTQAASAEPVPFEPPVPAPMGTHPSWNTPAPLDADGATIEPLAQTLPPSGEKAAG
jgi:sec-independent protein translocase protein TatB